MDVNYELMRGKLQKFPMDWKKFWREVEIFPSRTLKFLKTLAQIFFGLFHPKKAYLEFRNWLKTGNKRSTS